MPFDTSLQRLKSAISEANHFVHDVRRMARRPSRAEAVKFFADALAYQKEELKKHLRSVPEEQAELMYALRLSCDQLLTRAQVEGAASILECIAAELRAELHKSAADEQLTSLESGLTDAFSIVHPAARRRVLEAKSVAEAQAAVRDADAEKIRTIVDDAFRASQRTDA